MSEHTLPDDLSRWPGSPWELLGVAHGVNQRDLRRAYARLARTYKPEQFPEHFRRIREAYEALLSYAPFVPEPEVPDDSTVQSNDITTSNPNPRANAQSDVADSAGAERLPSPPLRTLQDEFDESWDWAINGDKERAYAGLLQLLDRYPRAEVCVRLYHLLRGYPELDAARAPCDFLVQGLCQGRGTGPCHELYRREIEDCPEEALSERFAQLLQKLDAVAQPGVFAAIYQWRLSAAGQLRQFDVIRNDLSQLCPQLADEHEEIWLRLLLSAAEQFAWAPSSGYIAECRREAYQSEHLQLQCADVFDRLEILEQTARGWRHLQDRTGVPGEFVQLLARSSTRPFSEIRRDVATLLAGIADRPKYWLRILDLVNVTSPLVLSLFGRLLDLYQWSQDHEQDVRDPVGLSTLARHFLEEFGRLGYTKLRPSLLAFCLREFVHPNFVADVAVSKTVRLPPARLNKLVSDWPLRHVYRACVLFWG
jgi:hypothetical protein